MDGPELERLLTSLVADRQALLATVQDADEQDLQQSTRNPGWTVQHVLAHVLAADADLIAILEAASRAGTHTHVPSTGEHEREMATWMTATLRAISSELGNRSERWEQLTIALGETSFAATVGGRKSTVGDLIADWQGHDVQHKEDVQLAVSAGSSHC